MGCFKSKHHPKTNEGEEAPSDHRPDPGGNNKTQELNGTLPESTADEIDGPRADLDVHIRNKWENEQENLKQQLILDDVDQWSKNKLCVTEESEHLEAECLKYIGGVDISFVKDDSVNACAALVVIELPSLKAVYEDYSMVKLTEPYIPGFLAFREVSFLVEKLGKLRQIKPQFTPQVIMVDGNGILHVKAFGLACHLGVLTGVPTLGVAKTLFHVDGIEKGEAHKAKIKENLLKAGDKFELIGKSGRVYGVALRPTDGSSNPVYVSPGHKVSLDTAVWSVMLCAKHRVPEPVRLADINSREYIRQNWKTDPT